MSPTGEILCKQFCFPERLSCKETSRSFTSPFEISPFVGYDGPLYQHASVKW